MLWWKVVNCPSDAWGLIFMLGWASQCNRPWNEWCWWAGRCKRCALHNTTVQWPKMALGWIICDLRSQKFLGEDPPHPPERGCLILSSFNKHVHTLRSSALHTFRLFGQIPFWSSLLCYFQEDVDFTVPSGANPARTQCMEMLKPLFTNVITKSYRFPTSDGTQLSVHEYMAESRYTYTIPIQLLWV